ncbi:MAG TPA: methionyl-tRNA formyltransferase [Alphaproteobacteria bacterium]|nr:methionyl-tRNA formyltransferase [Alphaproteobacteria bacterium]
MAGEGAGRTGRTLRLVFMGTPDFAAPALQALREAGHRIVAVYTQPPRPAGRGYKARRSPVHEAAEAAGLSVRTPASLKDPAEHAVFAALDADAAVVAAYGLILPRPILEAPRLGCLNIHASLLPRWRGAAPIQRAILAGDTETGVTIMQMDEGLDTGAVVLAQRVPITNQTTAGSLHDTLAELGARLVVAALSGLAAGRLNPTPQPPGGVTYARKITAEEGRLDWSRPAAELSRVVRAMAPAPGAWFEHEGGRVKVLAAEIVGDAAGAPPGTLIDDRLTVACGHGALRLLTVQRAGKAALAADAFLRGFPMAPGLVLA